MLPRTTRTAALCIAFAFTAGCAPITLGAHAIQPSNAVDTHNVWIYLQTNDAKRTGVYRCYDNGQKPVCVQATMDHQ